MDRAPLTPTEFAALRPGLPAPLSPAQAAALRRAAELAIELNAIVASVRAHLVELDAARAVAPPEVEPTVEPLPVPPPEVEPTVEPLPVPPPEVEPTVEPLPVPPPEVEETTLEPGDLRSALTAAQDSSPARPRPRWADTLLGDE